MSFSFYKNIDYIKNKSFGAVISIKNNEYQINNRSLYIVQNLCLYNLFSLEGYYQGVKKVTNYKYNIPVLINYDLILISSLGIKEYDNLWINFNNVHCFDELNNIVFKSGSKLIFNNSRNYYNKQIEKINTINKIIKRNNK